MERLKRLNGLSEHSVFYKDKAAVYEKFSEAEDAPNKILKTILPKLKNKIVLDVGCGTGKYAKLLAPHVRQYYGLDISNDQLLIAKKKTCKLKNINFICADAAETRLSNNSFDAAIASWAISPIAGFPRKAKAIARTFRTLKNGGIFYLIENDSTGTFEKARGAHRREETEEYNRWIKKQGFKIFKKIKTYFKFSSKKEAKRIFGAIWGNEVANKIRNKKIFHHVIIFQKRNSNERNS